MTIKQAKAKGFFLLRMFPYTVTTTKTSRYIMLHSDTRADDRRYYQFINKNGDILLVEENDLETD